MQLQHEHVDVIVLDIKRTHKQYDEYDKLSSEEKIEKIYSMINSTMEKFLENHDMGMKIFVCREYFISDPGSKFCTNDIRKILKDKMSSLAQKYPTLCIISGTVSTKKHFEKLHLEKYNANIDKTEDAYKHALSKNSFLKDNYDKKQKAKTTVKRRPAFSGEVPTHFTQWSREKNKDAVDMVRNTCYIFQNNTILRRDKLLPFQETGDPFAKNVAFRPGRGETADPIKLLMHPHTGKQIPILIEICAEHKLGYAKMIVDENPDKIKPTMHFVLSDTIDACNKNICSDCFIHVDSFWEPKIIEHLPSDNDAINLYKFNVLDSDFSLKKSYEDLSLALLDDFLDKCITKLRNEHAADSISLQKEFETIKEQFTGVHRDNPEFFNQLWKECRLGEAIFELTSSIPSMSDPLNTLGGYKTKLNELLDNLEVIKQGIDSRKANRM